MENKGFYIVFSGDPTVGIDPTEWKIEGGFLFDNKKEKEEFMKDLLDLFVNNITGTPCRIESFEFREKRINELKEG